jgi:hypothetical protein
MWAIGHLLDRVEGRWQRPQGSPAYSALALDNVQIGKRGIEIISRNTPDWKYAGREDTWNEGFLEYLTLVKQALHHNGYKLIVNHTMEYGVDGEEAVWKRLASCVDGLMTERPFRWHYEHYAYDKWLRAIERHKWVLDQKLLDWCVVYPDVFPWGRKADFLYNYCSWLLTHKPGQSLWFATQGDPSDETNRVPYWYEIYDCEMGQSGTWGRYQLGNCWVRNYATAQVVVNPTHETQEVELDGRTWVLHAQTGRL